VLIIVIIIVRLAPFQSVALLAANNLQRGLCRKFSAITLGRCCSSYSGGGGSSTSCSLMPGFHPSVAMLPLPFAPLPLQNYVRIP